MLSLEPLGEHAFLARFSDESEAGAWACAVREGCWPGVLDVVLAYNYAAVYADPGVCDLDALEARLRTHTPGALDNTSRPPILLPVLYDGEDLPDVARRTGLTEAGVVEAHSARTYDVFAIGFQPGFPYAGYLPEALSHIPRRDSPRVRVPAGSVAIAGRQTGVYPSESPGGWKLLGRTPLRIVDLERGRFPIRARDRIRFVPIGPEEFEARKGELL